MATVMTTTFELCGADGGALRGDVRTAQAGKDRPAVVICHGFKGFKDWGFFPRLADRIARAGFTAVSFNFSSSGIGPDGESFSEPERFGHGTFSHDLIDIDTVTTALRTGSLVSGLAQPTGIGLLGHSRGGGMALVHAADSPFVAALVTWSAIGTVRRWPDAILTEWRSAGQMDIVNSRTGEVLPLYCDLLDDIEKHENQQLDICAAATRIAIPWLLLHGDGDETVPLTEAHNLYDALVGGSGTLQIVPGGTHTMGGRHPWAGFTSELKMAMEETVTWFSRHLA